MLQLTSSIPLKAFKEETVLKGLFSGVNDSETIGMDAAFKKTMQKRFASRMCDDEKYMYIEIAKKDFIVRFKKFDSETDGEFVLVILMEVNLLIQKLTGHYIYFKLKEVESSA